MLSTTHPAEVAVYARFELRPVRGEGCFLWDAEGRRYLDMYGGHAVALTGHSHPRVVEAIARQAGDLLFYSNALPLTVRDELLTRLARLAPAGTPRVFLVNSGAEANEQALTVARRVTGRARIVSCSGGFHGRTLATLAASGIEKYRRLAEAGGAGQTLLELTTAVPFNDDAALQAAVDDHTAAVIVEPIQGLAGARAAAPEFLSAARAACAAAGAMLIFDEVQCGCGRSGAFTAAQAYGVTPDLLTLAKGIASGLPMGAVLMSEAIAGRIHGGELGTTFGGGPVPCAAAAASLDVLVQEDLAGNAGRMERLLRAGVAALPAVTAVSGKGLLLGLVLDRPAKPVQQALFARQVLVGSSEDANVMRLLPPLVLGTTEVELFLNALNEVLT